MTRLKTEPGSHRDPARTSSILASGAPGYGSRPSVTACNFWSTPTSWGSGISTWRPSTGWDSPNRSWPSSSELAPTSASGRSSAFGRRQRVASLGSCKRRCGVCRNSHRRPRPRSGKSGAGLDKGFFDRVLYSGRDYSAATAHLALTSSLRELGTDHIDCFMLHEPVGAEPRSFESRVNCLGPSVNAA